MSENACGILKREITVKELFDFVRAVFDPYATVEQHNSHVYNIVFDYVKEDGTLEGRMLAVYYGHDYAVETGGYSQEHEVTEISVTKWGNAEKIITSFVAHFGGWYIHNDCKDESIFYEFTN